MSNKILGLHHITAIAGNARRNFQFYTRVLGLRLVKKTVNFDDPGTYHFYFGDEAGSPGTILTFFPWEGMRKGSAGTGMATEIAYSVPLGSLVFWKQRFEEHKVPHKDIEQHFGENSLAFTDPDGLQLRLVEPKATDLRTAWTGSGISEAEATKGFHSVVLTLRHPDATASILTDIFGYSLQGQEGNRIRFATSAIETAHIVDILHEPAAHNGLVATGTNHHVAFRVRDEETLMNFREKIASKNIGITGKIDRNYFYSLYFREPGGVLFELATDNPGFAIDEKLSELGTSLKLPAQYERNRKEIEQVLPAID